MTTSRSMTRSSVALLSVFFLLLGACGGGDAKEPEGDMSIGDESLLPTEKTTVPADPAAPATTAAPAKTAAPRAGGTTATTGAAAPTTLAPTKRSVVTAPPAPSASGESGSSAPSENDIGKGPTGSFAPTLLRAASAKSIVVQFLNQRQSAPAKEAIDHLVSRLERVSGKQVTVEQKAIPGGGQDLTHQQVVLLADKYGTANMGGDVATLHVVYVDGSSSDSPSAGGTAMRGDVIGVWAKTLRSLPALPGGGAAIEKTLLLHEVGHLLSLVDFYLATGRQDPDHPGHSRNKGSVMYWAVETTDVIAVFGQGGPPAEFDAADLADLANIKDGAARGSKG